MFAGQLHVLVTLFWSLSVLDWGLAGVCMQWRLGVE